MVATSNLHNRDVIFKIVFMLKKIRKVVISCEDYLAELVSIINLLSPQSYFPEISQWKKLEGNYLILIWDKLFSD